MKKLCALIIGCVFLSVLCASPGYAEPSAKAKAVLDRLAKDIDGSALLKAPVKAFAKGKLLPLCVNAVWVAETKAQNAKAMPMDEIKKIDVEWSAAESELPIQKEKMGNACAQEIKKIISSVGALGEVFVMDNQGANVGQNELTSDYWQGDEPKWQGAFKGGAGGVDVAEEKLDKSSGVMDQKISLPILDEEGKAIGAVCFGIKVQQL